MIQDNNTEILRFPKLLKGKFGDDEDIVIEIRIWKSKVLIFMMIGINNCKVKI